MQCQMEDMKNKMKELEAMGLVKKAQDHFQNFSSLFPQNLVAYPINPDADLHGMLEAPYAGSQWRAGVEHGQPQQYQRQGEQQQQGLIGWTGHGVPPPPRQPPPAVPAPPPSLPPVGQRNMVAAGPLRGLGALNIGAQDAAMFASLRRVFNMLAQGQSVQGIQNRPGGQAGAAQLPQPTPKVKFIYRVMGV